MFTLVISVRRGSACGIPGSWHSYQTLEEARTAGVAIGRDERVARVAVVRNDAPPVFIEWLDRR